MVPPYLRFSSLILAMLFATSSSLAGFDSEAAGVAFQLQRDILEKKSTSSSWVWSGSSVESIPAESTNELAGQAQCGRRPSDSE